MINDRLIDQAYSDLRPTNGGVREDYFGLLYLEQEHSVSRARVLNQVGQPHDEILSFITSQHARKVRQLCLAAIETL